VAGRQQLKLQVSAVDSTRSQEVTLFLDSVQEKELDMLPTLGDSASSLLFTEARTARSFAAEPVGEDALRSIWELIKWAPTGVNCSPLRILYVRTEAAKEKLLPHLDEGNRSGVRSAPVVAVLAVDTRYHDHLPTLWPVGPDMKELLEGSPLRDSLGRFNAAVQVGYFILGVRAAGLSAGPMGGFDSEAVDREFFAGSTWRSVLLVNIGHPESSSPHRRLPRLSFDDVSRMI
jgi:3-hydroxypropanoate dehydrogenase